MFWFKFRQVIPQPPGRWVLCGPYGTHAEAMRARERAKAPDAEVSIPFGAATREAAERVPV